MTAEPELSIIVAAYQRPQNLHACLTSIAMQTIAGPRIEVVVADDGSTDDTPAIVERFRQRVGFEVRFTTHPHDGFGAGRCRNDGVRASRAPYLLFVDQDCILPADHARVHLAARRPNVVCGSDAYRLTAAESGRLLGEGGDGPPPTVSLRERWRVRRDHLDAQLNWGLRNPDRPRLIGCDIGMWRRDFERVNGFDQKLSGWGGDDDDLRLRLRQAGVTIRSIRNLTVAWHLWHPPASTKPTRWKDGPNAHYLQRRFRLTRCIDGLTRRRPEDVTLRVRNPKGQEAVIGLWEHAGVDPVPPAARVDVEVLFCPGPDRFTGNADCNVLIVTERDARAPLRDAHVLITDQEDLPWRSGPRLRLAECARLWDVVR